MNNVPYVLVVAVLLVSVSVIGCDTNEVADTEIVDISILPKSATIEEGESRDFSVVGLTASGEEVQDAQLDGRWWSTDSTVFTVTDDGTATGRDSGSAYCMVEVNSLSKVGEAQFVGRDSAFITVLK